MVERIGIVGLGVMGTAMSGHLIEAGYTVGGYDIAEDRVALLESRGGTGYGSAAEVASNSDLVLFSLASVEALEDATDGVVAGAHDGLIAAEMGVLPIDAKEQAADATLVVMASGTREAYDTTKAVFDVIGRATYYLGPFPNGSVMKFIANLLVAIHNLSSAEAHALGIAAGMDPDVVQEVIADGVGSSRIFEIRGPMMASDTYEPPSARLDIIKKDATIIQAFARSVGSPTPLLDTALPVYQEASDAGLGDLDAAALCRHLERIAGLHRG